MELNASFPPSGEDRESWLSRLAGRLVAGSWEAAPRILAGAGVLTVLLAIFAATRLQMDTQTSRLIDPTLPWRQQELAYNEAFPQGKRVLAVIVEADGAAAKAAGTLAAALAERRDVISSVSYLEGLPFLRENGLLLQDLPRVQQTAEQLGRMERLFGPFLVDPSLRGFFDSLSRALTGVKMGMVTPEQLAPRLQAVADVIAARQAGRAATLSLSAFFSGANGTPAAPNPRERMQIVTVKPVLNHNSLAPGRAAREAVLQTAAALHLTEADGVRISFTGDVALEDDELGSVKAGMGFATLLSSLLVLAILFAAIRAAKPVLAILITLVTGLIATLAFAAASVHALNLISVAFVVMFIGIAVDFGIQFCVRFRDEQTHAGDAAEAVLRTGRSIGGALSLAAITTAIGFLAFAPTAYRGVSELGLIAGAGMLIALFLNLTLLPALLRYLGASPASEPPHLFKTGAVDYWIKRNRRLILGAALILALCSAALLPRLTFDFNPLNLKDPNAPSVRALDKLTEAGLASPNAMQLLVSDPAAVGAFTAQLEALPEVGRVTSIERFIPKDQDEKRAALGPVLESLSAAVAAGRTAQAPGAAEIRESIRDMANRLELLAQDPAMPPAFAALAAQLRQLLNRDNRTILEMDAPLTGALEARLTSLAPLPAEPISAKTLPPEIKQQWMSPDGRYRVEIRPKAEMRDNDALRRFAAAVQSVAPAALGGASTIVKSGDAVWQAFQQAFLYALIGVAAVLGLMLRRALDVALIVGPLLVSALFTLGLTVLVGLPINFANVIALPLLMGIGVAFNIYFVTNWRRGERRPLQSSTARAVVFSAMTTLCAVFSLALSPHLGTASMGQLLTLCLTVTLISALLLLPALLALGRGRRKSGPSNP